jgi:transcriptional regulator with XRE-family HTH domain
MPNRLNEWCEQHGATVTDMADLCGLSVSYLSLIVREKREPPATTKLAIARALGERVRDLFPPAEQVSA